MKVNVKYANGMEINITFPTNQQTLENALKVVRVIQQEFATTPIHSLYVEFEEEKPAVPSSQTTTSAPLQKSVSRYSGSVPQEDTQVDINKLMNVLTDAGVSARTKWMLLELFRKTGRRKFTTSVQQIREQFKISVNTVLRFYDDLKNVPGVVVERTKRGTVIDLSRVLTS